MANILTLVGNVGKNPEIVVKEKAEFANFSICVNHTEGGSWFNVSVSNQHIVAFVKEHVKQGDMVFVSGQLRIDEYKTATGKENTAVKCVVSYEGQVRKLHKADPEAREKRARGGE